MKNVQKNQYTAVGKERRTEKPVPDIYPVIDNDLARDNLENDIPAADLHELRPDAGVYENN